MKILNLYSGIGGNRKLWGNDHDITAVEWDRNIAQIYIDNFTKDEVRITDAHQFLLTHYQDYDFIWSSPPCPTHSRIRNEAGVGNGQNKPVFPDMKLYEEIIFLEHMYKLKNSGFKGRFVVENVISYYEPLIKPQIIGQHYFWSNFPIRQIRLKTRNHFGSMKQLYSFKGFDLSTYKGIDKRAVIRNCVEPELGLHILNEAMNKKEILGNQLNFI